VVRDGYPVGKADPSDRTQFKPVQSSNAVGVNAMIDVVQALELFEICADEMASEDATGDASARSSGSRRMTLTARALAKRQLHVAHLVRFPLRNVLDRTQADEPAMTLGAMIVFRTADRFVRAGASTTRTIDALYRAVERYLDLVPSSIQDSVDQAAVGALIGETGRPLRPCRPSRPSTTVGLGGSARPATCDTTAVREVVRDATRRACG
jgi:hypothetical protein